MTGSKCKHCNQFIAGNDKKMNVHLVACKRKRPYICDAKLEDGSKCGRHFESVKGLGAHRGGFHTAAEKGAKFSCDINGCGFGTDTPRSLEAHRERCRAGLLRRSRSHSRAPSVSRATSVSRAPSVMRRSSIPRTVTTEEGVGTPTAAAAIAERRRSAAGAATPSRPASRAHVQNNDDVEGFRASPGAADGVPVSPFPTGIVDAQGLYNLRLLDPATARKIMYEQHKSLDHLMDDMQKKLDTLKSIVDDKQVPADLSELEKQLKEYREKFAADALEKSGQINLGIAERALAEANDNEI
uniref:C2H2-type domain-containing protein n=1 Tax=Globodera rostochiensis TaxID=31243 RepID=A0A914IEM7_GLORO